MAISNQPIRTTPAQRPLVPARAVMAAPAPKVAQPVVQQEVKRSFKERMLRPVLWALHTVLQHLPITNGALGHITGPIVKRQFNPPPGEVAPPAPAQLKPETVEEARKIMAERFQPKAGKVIIGISGGGPETVHCFVVSGVKPDGTVMITQALAQATGPKEPYKGIGGWVEKKLDQWLGNSDRQMAGVVEESWTGYAERSHRNTVVLMELEADPAKIEKTLAELKTFVGRPYDHTMLAGARGTRATTAGMYCTEVSSWFVNELRPGTIQQSDKSGWKVFQVADHMRATEVHGGPLKVLYNGQNRLDIAAINPIARFEGTAIASVKAAATKEAEQAEVGALRKLASKAGNMLERIVTLRF
jgi:hypothetical protein